MPPKTKSRMHPFNVLLSGDELAHLQAIANDVNVSKGHIVRSLIQRAWMMQGMGVPTCADGCNCFVPQMHASRLMPKIPEQPRNPSPPSSGQALLLPTEPAA